MKKLSVKFFKEVSFWNTNEGQGVKVDGTKDDSRWGIDIDGLNGLINLDGVEDVQKALLDYLNRNIDVRGGLTAESLTIMDDGRVTFCLIENGEGESIYDENTYSEKLPHSQLYICDYDIMLELHEVSTPSTDVLAELLPNAERGF